TDTGRLPVAAQANVPIVMDVSAAFGDPDRLAVSLPGNAAIAEVTDPELAPGFWFALPEPQGPFPPGGIAPGATVNVAAVADANGFDGAVSPDTGDVWQQAVNPAAPFPPLA